MNYSTNKQNKMCEKISRFSTHFDPKLCVFRWPSENFEDWPVFNLIELDFAGETFNEAMPDSRLQKLLAPWFIKAAAGTANAALDVSFFVDLGGGSSLSDFLKIKS